MSATQLALPIVGATKVDGRFMTYVEMIEVIENVWVYDFDADGWILIDSDGSLWLSYGDDRPQLMIVFAGKLVLQYVADLIANQNPVYFL